MKVMIVIALALVALAAAAPLDPVPPQILRSVFFQDPNGEYNYGFETENGINREETGQLKETLDQDNKPNTVVVVRGSYTYTDKDGKVETVNYFADETGYHAEGDSIPKSPSRR